MLKYSVNENDIKDWVEAAKEIKDHYDIDRALQYLIGEKFYEIVSAFHSSRKLLRIIDKEMRKADYKSIGIAIYRNLAVVTDVNQLYLEEAEIITNIAELLEEFAALINNVFEYSEIREYFKSNPCLGAASVEEYRYLVSRGMVHNSLDTEIRDALIWGDMMKYFAIE